MKQNNRIVILGMSGSGKSWLGRYILTKYYCAPDIRDLYVVLDTSETHFRPEDRSEEFGLEKIGFRHLPVTNDLLEKGIRWSDYFKDHSKDKLVIELDDLTPEDMEDQGNRIAAAILERGNAVFMLDEAQIMFRQGAARSPKGIMRLLTGGRKRGVGAILIAQHFAFIDKLATQGANKIIAYSTSSPNELKHYKDIFDNAKEILPGLDRYQFIYRNQETSRQFVIDGKDLVQDAKRAGLI